MSIKKIYIYISHSTRKVDLLHICKHINITRYALNAIRRLIAFAMFAGISLNDEMKQIKKRQFSV